MARSGRRHLQEALATKLAEGTRYHALAGAEARVTALSDDTGAASVQAELVLANVDLEEGANLELGFSVRWFDHTYGLSVDDTLVVVEVDDGEWRAVDVLTDKDP